MIRFVELNKDYYLDPEGTPPICAFLCTTADKFLVTENDSHVFDIDDIREHEQSERLLSLTPEYFK